MGKLISADNNSNPTSSSRQLLYKDITKKTSRKIWLTITGMLDGDCIKLPLTRNVIPVKLGDEPKEWPVVLVPFRMRGKGLKNKDFDCDKYKTEDLKEREYYVNPYSFTEGYIYVFVDGYLWRELEIDKDPASSDSYFSDIDLLKHSKSKKVNTTNSQGRKIVIDQRDIRLATGKRDKRILLPYVKNGKNKFAKVQVCYSRVQWSWLIIESMGGIVPAGRKRDNWFLDESLGENKVGQKLRERRCQTVPLVDYKNGYDKVGDIGPVGQSNTFTYSIDYGKGVPFLDVGDPIGIALQLKADHMEAIAASDTHAEIMESREFPLATLVKQVLESENQSNKAGEKQAKKNKKSFTPSTRFKERIDIPKLDRSLKYWKDSKQNMQKHVYYTGRVALHWIKDTTPTNPFNTALDDYTVDNTTLRFAMGLGIWTELVEGFSFKQGYDYIKSVAEPGNGEIGHLGRIITDPSPEHIDLLHDLEAGTFNRVSEQAKWGAKDTIVAADYLNKIVRDTLKGLTLYASTGGKKEGLQRAAKLFRKFYPKFEATIETVSAHLRYAIIKHPSPDIFQSFRPPSDTFKKTSVSYIKLHEKHTKTINGKTTKELGKIVKDSKSYNLVIGARVVIEILNVSVYWGTLMEKIESGTDKAGDYANLGVAIGGAIEGIAGFAKDVREGSFKAAKKEYNTRKSRQERLDREYKRAQSQPKNNSRSDLSRKKHKILGNEKKKNNQTSSKAKNQLPKSIRRVEKSRKKYLRLKRIRSFLNWTNVIFAHLSAASKIVYGGIAIKEAFDERNWGEMGGAASQGIGGLMVTVGVNIMARAAFAAAAGTASTGAGIPLAVILVVAGLLLYFIGEIVMKYFHQTELEKAVRYGFFGTNPYTTIRPGYIRPGLYIRKKKNPLSGKKMKSKYYIKEFVSYKSWKVEPNHYPNRATGNSHEEVSTSEGIIKYGWKIEHRFIAELQEIYGELYNFSQEVEIYKVYSDNQSYREVYNSSIGKRTMAPIHDSTDWYAIVGTIRFGRFMDMRSKLLTVFDLYPGPAIWPKPERIKQENVFIKELRNKDQSLEGVTFTLLIHKNNFQPVHAMVKSGWKVKIRSMLDIYGTGTFTIPGQNRVKSSKNKKELSDSQFKTKTSVRYVSKQGGEEPKFITESQLISRYNAPLNKFKLNGSLALTINRAENKKRQLCSIKDIEKYNFQEKERKYYFPEGDCEKATKKLDELNKRLAKGSSTKGTKK